MSTPLFSTACAVHCAMAVVTLNNPLVNGLGHALRSSGQSADGLFEVC